MIVTNPHRKEKKMDQQKKGYIIPHTHWDREWRYPIWENMLYLVKLVEELMDTLERNPGYQSFLFDGQVIAVLDYLRVRPENKERLQKLIKDKRIDIGPWYTLPDLYPINGESIIRNLLKGTRESEKLGNCLKIGYESFGWGQPSQLPQIYQGFGIDTVIVSKNVDKSRAPECEFKWTGADHTSVYATRLGTDARANFFMNAYIHIMNGKVYKSDDYNFHPGVDGQIYHQADDEGYIQDYFRIEDTEEIHQEYIREAVEKAWTAMDDTLLPDHRALMDGSDSTTSQPQLMKLIEKINSQFSDIQFSSSSLEEYITILKSKLDLADLTEVKGEMRDGPTTSLSGNALMTRPHIKTLNKQAQNTLYYGAEPFSVVSSILGGPYDNGFLDKAMDYMLLSHAHDSINGVTQDKTVDDVIGRLSQSLEISKAIYNLGCQNIVKNLNLSSYQKNDVLLVVFNPCTRERREVIKVFIDTPASLNIWEFAIVNSANQLCDVQHLSRDEAVIPVVHLQTRPSPLYADRHCIMMDTGSIPSGGYMVYRLCDPENFNRKTEFWAKTRMTKGLEIAASTSVMENKYLYAAVENNGSITLTDKTTGQIYSNLNCYESTGDVGDYWMYYPPYANKTFTSKGCHADIWLEENGELSATIGVRIAMNLPKDSKRPKNYMRGESRRSHQMKKLTVVTHYTLKRDSKYLEVKVEIDQCIKDHRMSVLFESGVQSEYIDASGHFTVDRRNILPLKNQEGYYYNELTTQPFQNFASYTNQGRGLGIITDCLGEYEVRDDGRGTMAFTLFRAVKNIICTEWRCAGEFPDQQGGQLQQKLTYHYGIYPMKDDWMKSQMVSLSEHFNVPLKAVQTCVPKHTKGTLPGCHSFYELTGNLSLSCFKKAEDSHHFIARIYNPTPEPEKGEFILNYPIRRVYETTLNEEKLKELEAAGGRRIELNLQPNKIITLEIEI